MTPSAIITVFGRGAGRRREGVPSAGAFSPFRSSCESFELSTMCGYTVAYPVLTARILQRTPEVRPNFYHYSPIFFFSRRNIISREEERRRVRKRKRETGKVERKRGRGE